MTSLTDSTDLIPRSPSPPDSPKQPPIIINNGDPSYKVSLRSEVPVITLPSSEGIDLSPKHLTSTDSGFLSLKSTHKSVMNPNIEDKLTQEWKNTSSQTSSAKLKLSAEQPKTHKRFPSTGISLQTGPDKGSNMQYSTNVTQTTSYGVGTHGRKASLGNASSALALSNNSIPSSNSTQNLNQLSLSQQTSRSHRRQASVGRSEQKQVNFCPYDGYCFVLDEPRCASCGEERSSLAIPRDVNHQPWKKVLYEKQGYEDNYTDRDTFLRELKKNVNVQEYSYQLVMFDSFAVTQQITIVVLFASIFHFAVSSKLNAQALGAIDIITALSGFLIWSFCTNMTTRLVSLNQSSSFWFTFTGILKLVGYSLGLYVLSPVLAALTDPISDDTIAALSIILLVVHLSFQDYGYLNPVRIKSSSSSTSVSSSSPVSNSKVSHPTQINHNESISLTSSNSLYHAPVSLNAGIFASLMMASRLSNHNLAFALIAFAIELFALFPIMAHHLKVKSWWGAFVVQIALVLAAVILLSSISKVITYIYVGTTIFTTFVSPFCLQWIQRYKNEIQGPWDEAVPARAKRHGTRQ